MDATEPDPDTARQGLIRSLGLPWRSFAILAALFLVLLQWVPVKGPPMSAKVPLASGFIEGTEHLPRKVVDFRRQEAQGAATQWLVGQGGGWVELEPAYVGPLRRIDILNTGNTAGPARARVEMKADGAVLWTGEADLSPYPRWTRMDLPPELLVERVRVYILPEDPAAISGLNEVRLVAATPLGARLEPLARFGFAALLLIPAFVFWRALEPMPAGHRIGILATLGLLLLATQWQILARVEFPSGHEFMNHRDRLTVYAWHLLRGEPLPIWASTSALGHGSVFPVFYHRLFYYLAIPGYLLTGSVKLAILSTIAACSIGAVAGMVRLLRRIGLEPLSAILLALAFPLLNYTYFNWIERQAFAEFTGMCLLPWMFLWCLACWQEIPMRRLFLSGILLFPALYFAHSLMFFLSAVPVISAVLLRMRRERGIRVGTLAGLAGIGAVFAILTLPWLVLQFLLAPTLNFSQVISVYIPTDWMLSFWTYFVNPGLDWGGATGIKILLDWPILLPLLGVSATLLLGWRKTGWQSLASPQFIFMALLALWYLFLQTPLATPIYAHVPGFSLIQFAWRAIALVTVLELALLAAALVALRPLLGAAAVRWQRAGAAAATVLAIAFTPYWATIHREWYNRHEFESIRPASIGGSGFTLGDYWPYLPFSGFDERFTHILELQPRPDARRWSADGYSIERLDPHIFEDMQYDYRLEVSADCTVMLPVSFSGMEQLFARNPGGNWQRMPIRRTNDDFRIQFDALPGDYEIRLLLPSWSLLLGFQQP